MATHWKVLIVIWLTVAIAVGIRSAQKTQVGIDSQKIERAK